MSSDERFDCVIISRLTTKGINTSLVDWCMRTCQNPLHIKFRPKLKIRSRMTLAQEFGNNLHHCGRLIFLFVCYQSSRDRNIRVGPSSGVVLKRLKLIRRATWLLIFIILCANYILKCYYDQILDIHFFYIFVHNRSFLVILLNFKLLRTLQRAFFEPLFPII